MTTEKPARRAPARASAAAVKDLPAKPEQAAYPPHLGQLPELDHEGEHYFSPEALCRRWGHSVRMKTLKNWRNLGRGPTFVKFGRSVYYPLAALQDYERREMKLPVRP